MLVVYTGDELLYEGPTCTPQIRQSTHASHVQETQPNLSDIMSALQDQQALLEKVIIQRWDQLLCLVITYIHACMPVVRCVK